MIFVTVGTQLPFDRLARAVDAWAGRRRASDVFAQIGPTPWRPVHMQWAAFLTADECRRRTIEASVVVAHAGMGSILTALELGKPIIVMPRRADLQEHRNDHQMATARWFAAQGRISVAFDEEELCGKLDEADRIRSGQPISGAASPELVDAVRQFATGGD